MKDKRKEKGKEGEGCRFQMLSSSSSSFILQYSQSSVIFLFFFLVYGLFFFFFDLGFFFLLFLFQGSSRWEEKCNCWLLLCIEKLKKKKYERK